MPSETTSAETTFSEFEVIQTPNMDAVVWVRRVGWVIIWESGYISMSDVSRLVTWLEESNMLQFKSPSRCISFCSESRLSNRFSILEKNIYGTIWWSVESSDYKRPSIWFINFDTNSLKIFRRDMIQVAIANRVIYENTNPMHLSISSDQNELYHNLEYLRDRQKSHTWRDANKCLVSKFHTISPPWRHCIY
jgi:hypothetical protein